MKSESIQNKIMSIKYVVSIKITQIAATIPEDIPEEEVSLDDYFINSTSSSRKEIYDKPLYLADTKKEAEELAEQLK